MPRTRGGLPTTTARILNREQFAPHTRGSTLHDPLLLILTKVCPAHAGVYLARTGGDSRGRRLPRTRGGLPSFEDQREAEAKFAPHTRGSTGTEEKVGT